MRPESASVIFRDDIAALVQEYMDTKAASKFIGRRAAPLFVHPLYAGEYPIFRRDAFKKRTEDARAADGRYNRIIAEFGRGTFSTADRGLETFVDKRTQKRFLHLFDAEVAAAKPLVHQVLMGHEARVASLYASAPLTGHNVSAAWSNSSTAVPLDDLQSGIDALSDACGCMPEDITLIIPRKDYQEMMRTAQVSDKCKYTYPGVVPSMLAPDEVSAMLRIKNVLVGNSAYDSKEEGIAESNTQFWTPGAIYLAVLANGPEDDLSVPSAARTIVCGSLEDDLTLVDVDAVVDDFLVIESYVSAETRSTVLRVRAEYDQILQVPDDPDCLIYKIVNASN
ncbi:MAG TPA: hypothetical protein PKY88_12770 [Anaerohalosphaeraceae bacterium]|nr:hypothetical protein [Anaerohalosphaeraceae bacterium]